MLNADLNNTNENVIMLADPREKYMGVEEHQVGEGFLLVTGCL